MFNFVHNVIRNITSSDMSDAIFVLANLMLFASASIVIIRFYFLFSLIVYDDIVIMLLVLRHVLFLCFDEEMAVQSFCLNSFTRQSIPFDILYLR